MENVANYTIKKETEKAIYVSIPFWVPTNEYKKKHENRKYECWVPKSLITQECIPAWFLKKTLAEVESRRPYKNAQSNPLATHRMNTLGEIAPEKERNSHIIVDEEKLSELKKELMKKYNVKHYDQGFFINPQNNITEDVEKLAKIYRRGDIKDKEIPKKTVYTYH